MIIRRVMTEADLLKFAEMAKINPSREYDCTVAQYIQVIGSIYKKPWNRLWIAVVNDEAIGYLWATADTTTLRDQVNVGDLFVKEPYRKICVARDLLNVLGEWAYGTLKAKRIKWHSPLPVEQWERLLLRLKHPVTVNQVNCYVATGDKSWGEQLTS